MAKLFFTLMLCMLIMVAIYFAEHLAVNLFFKYAFYGVALWGFFLAKDIQEHLKIGRAHD